MKIYTKLIMNWDFDVIETESFDYEGPVSFCGGSSGGGGSSGKVDYPSYMKTHHDNWLKAVNGLLPIGNAYLSRNAPELNAIETIAALDALETYANQRLIDVGSLDYVPTLDVCPQAPMFFEYVGTLVCKLLVELNNDFTGTMSAEVTDQKIRLNNRLTEIGQLGDLEGAFDLETVVFPRFEAGMRDVNAVQSSMFVLGRGVIEGTYLYKIAELREQLKQETIKVHQELTQLASTLHLENQKKQDAMYLGLWDKLNALVGVMGSVVIPMDEFFSNIQKHAQGLRLEVLKLRMDSFKGTDALISDFVAKRMEHGRLVTVARFEHASMNADFDEKERRWDLENYQYAANMLASIGGGTVSPGSKNPNKFQSALGGALSGAAAGAMVGGGVGALVGGVIGAGASLLA